MNESFFLTPPAADAQLLRDQLLGALIGLARATTSEPKSEDTDDVLNAGLRLAAKQDAPEERLRRMIDIVHTEKHRIAPNCATCAMPCGNTADYDLARFYAAPQPVHALKQRLFAALFRLAQRPDEAQQYAIYQGLFTLAEDWDETLLTPVVTHAEELCSG